MVLPWLWALPALLQGSLQQQCSGAVLCLFAAHLLPQWLGPAAPAPAAVAGMGLVVAQWLMAWGDAFVTGMLTAVFVAYKPAWLLTWSDPRYL